MYKVFLTSLLDDKMYIILNVKDEVFFYKRYQFGEWSKWRKYNIMHKHQVEKLIKKRNTEVIGDFESYKLAKGYVELLELIGD